MKVVKMEITYPKVQLRNQAFEHFVEVNGAAGFTKAEALEALRCTSKQFGRTLGDFRTLLADEERPYSLVWEPVDRRYRIVGDWEDAAQGRHYRQVDLDTRLDSLLDLAQAQLRATPVGDASHHVASWFVRRLVSMVEDREILERIAQR